MTVALTALLLAAALPPGSTLTVDAGASVVTYHIVHKFHRVDGVSKQIEGKAVVQPDGQVLAMVRLPVASFRSGDANRDQHALEALGADRHPFVVFKGRAQLGAGGEIPPGKVPMEGEVELHGAKRAVTVPLTLEPQADGALRAKGRFVVSLDSFGVERPSLLFIKIDDACAIDLDLLLRR